VLAQCYLAWSGALNRFVDEAKTDKRDTERARFVVSLLVDAMSPTNWLGGNPAALKRLVDTGGGSLLAKTASQTAGVLQGRELARMFAWMRPNDLIWNYWVNNYLLGNAPPAFDILYWNNDTTRLPPKLHADFLDLIGQSVRQSRPDRGARRAARHEQGAHGHVCHRRPDRSHHALAGML
jgi:poly(3-hydroxyalkanoate) synthetase